MKRMQTIAGVLVGGLVLAVLGANAPARATETVSAAPVVSGAPVVVGTFDSRAVAVAYVRSKAFNDYLALQQADVERLTERARAQGDTRFVAALDALGPEMQEHVHEQGFSTAPVDDILARVESELPRVAEQAGVDLIVSRWEVDWMRADAPVVDLTFELAALFEPDEQTLEGIRQLIAQEPVAPEDLRHEH